MITFIVNLPSIFDPSLANTFIVIKPSFIALTLPSTTVAIESSEEIHSISLQLALSGLISYVKVISSPSMICDFPFNTISVIRIGSSFSQVHFPSTYSQLWISPHLHNPFSNLWVCSNFEIIWFSFSPHAQMHSFEPSSISVASFITTHSPNSCSCGFIQAIKHVVKITIK